MALPSTAVRRQQGRPMSQHSTPTDTVSHSSDAAVAKEPVPGATATRREHDSLGEMEIAAASYYGIQTQRALDNFHISGVGINHYPNLIRSEEQTSDLQSIMRISSAVFCVQKK